MALRLNSQPPTINLLSGCAAQIRANSFDQTPKGLQPRKIIAQGKASPRTTPLGKLVQQIIQALKWRQRTHASRVAQMSYSSIAAFAGTKWSACLFPVDAVPALREVSTFQGESLRDAFANSNASTFRSLMAPNRITRRQLGFAWLAQFFQTARIPAAKSSWLACESWPALE
jgi:hypothetical protein